MIITINTITGVITINKEKGLKNATHPYKETPIQYNEIDITRKYYKKNEEWYKRVFKNITPKKVLKSLKSDKVVIQEPLLDFH